MQKDEIGLDKKVLIAALRSNSEANLRCPRFQDIQPIKFPENPEHQYQHIAEFILANWDLGPSRMCSGCPWKINSPEHLNCALIVFSLKEKTFQFNNKEIGDLLGFSEATIEDIMHNAEKKMREKLKKAKDCQELQQECVDSPTNTDEGFEV